MDKITELESGLSVVMERYLKKYFALHKGGEVPPGLYDRMLREVERSVISVTLEHTNMNQLKAAKILGINRNTLRKKIALCSVGEDR